VTQNPAFQRSNVIYSASVHLDGKRLINSLIPETPGLPAYGRVVPRLQFDAWIVDAARAAGAQLYEGWRVKGYAVDSDGVTVQAEQRGQLRTWRARALIGADGSSSLVARQMHGKLPSDRDRTRCALTMKASAALPIRPTCSFPAPAFRLLLALSDGDNGANVGIGMLLETLPAASEHLPRLLDQLIEQDSAFGERLVNARKIGKVAGWPLSTYNPSSPLVADRVLLAGDAAGLINPLNGEGIQYALLSGRWAAETAVQAAARNDSLRRN
jgi:flavin-dependent dehydrogenase